MKNSDSNDSFYWNALNTGSFENNVPNQVLFFSDSNI